MSYKIVQKMSQISFVASEISNHFPKSIRTSGKHVVFRYPFAKGKDKDFNFDFHSDFYSCEI